MPLCPLHRSQLGESQRKRKSRPSGVFPKEIPERPVMQPPKATDPQSLGNAGRMHSKCHIQHTRPSVTRGRRVNRRWRGQETGDTAGRWETSEACLLAAAQEAAPRDPAPENEPLCAITSFSIHKSAQNQPKREERANIPQLLSGSGHLRCGRSVGRNEVVRRASTGLSHANTPLSRRCQMREATSFILLPWDAQPS